MLKYTKPSSSYGGGFCDECSIGIDFPQGFYHCAVCHEDYCAKCSIEKWTQKKVAEGFAQTEPIHDNMK